MDFVEFCNNGSGPELGFFFFFFFNVYIVGLIFFAHDMDVDGFGFLSFYFMWFWLESIKKIFPNEIWLVLSFDDQIKNVVE